MHGWYIYVCTHLKGLSITGTFLTVKETVKDNVPVDTDSVIHKLG